MVVFYYRIKEISQAVWILHTKHYVLISSSPVYLTTGVGRCKPPSSLDLLDSVVPTKPFTLSC